MIVAWRQQGNASSIVSGMFDRISTRKRASQLICRLFVPYSQSPKRTFLASIFAVSENSERTDVRNATNRNDWRCLKGLPDC
jgi:hypothetical protein